MYPAPIPYISLAQYFKAARRLLGPNAAYRLGLFEVQHDGGWGKWVHYGRNQELRQWIPREYALMEEP